VSFEGNSELRRIGQVALAYCPSLHSIFIPSFVDTIAGNAFVASGIREIIVADENPNFKARGSFLMNCDGTSLIRYFGLDSHVEIFRDITVLCQQSFAQCSELREVRFESNSKLRRIESFAFSHCSSLQSIVIPSFVDTIAGNAFLQSGIREIIVADDNPNFKDRGSFLLNYDRTSLIGYFGRDSHVEIFREITVLCQQSFADCSELREVGFESNSKLLRIESLAFFHCSSLQSIVIPSFVDTIDGSAFAESGIREIIVAPDNPHFKVCDQFLCSHDGTSLVRYFGRDSAVKIDSKMEVLLSNSFAYCTGLTEIDFESGSRFRRIRPSAFYSRRGLGHISLPSSTQVLDQDCFADCGNLREVRFGPGSQLTRIEADSFTDCHSLKLILLPKSLRSNGAVDLTGATGFDLVWYNDNGSVDKSET
jgi:hypothetical protein